MFQTKPSEHLGGSSTYKDTHTHTTLRPWVSLLLTATSECNQSLMLGDWQSASLRRKKHWKFKQFEWVQVKISPCKMIGLGAPTSALRTPTFCMEEYFARIFDFYFFWVWVLLGPRPPKRHLCEPVALPLPCIFLTQPSIVFKEQSILFVRKWAYWYLRPVFLQCWQKVKRSYPLSFAQELGWKARLTRTSGMALHFEILVAATAKQQSCKH